MNIENFVFEAERLLPRLDPALNRGVGPFVLHDGIDRLPQAFRDFLRLVTLPGTIAATSPVLDILAGPALGYRRAPGRRAFAMYLPGYAAGHDRDTLWAAVMHEAAHFLCCTHPSRDDRDEQRALATWFTGRDAGDDNHGPRWARAAAHLAFRAAAIANIGFSVSRLFDQFGPGHLAMVFLRQELAERVTEPIEAVLRTPAPSGFSETWLGVAPPRSRAAASQSDTPPPAHSMTAVEDRSSITEAADCSAPRRMRKDSRRSAQKTGWPGSPQFFDGLFRPMFQ